MIGGQLGYARMADGVVYILAYEDDRYRTVRTDRDEQGEYLASDLTPWSPQNGERVTEANNEYGVTGTVVEAGEEISLVKWDSLRRQVSWVNSSLEPIWSD
jgi:hypothetical protein